MYEYKNVYKKYGPVPPRNSDGTCHLVEYDKFMNAYAKEGWELFSVYNANGCAEIVVVFRREVRQQ